VAAAIAAGAPIIPVAVIGFEVGRWWTIRFGRPIPTRRSRSVGDADEVATSTRQRLQHLLTDSRRSSH
jgi:1-acyl-sn-glycerol-3-phosphate acyltransferase